jgi:hypothetical protein
MDQNKREQLRQAVRFFYDLQKLRVGTGNRTSENVTTTELSESDVQFLGAMAKKLEGLEKDALKEVTRLIKPEPIYQEFFSVRPDQKGCGPTMSGLIMAEVNIERCNTVSQLWAWTGLAVRDGHADRRVKGQKARFDPWLKSKMIKVLGECLIKANSPWRSFYDNYKNRKRNTLVEACMGCSGTGRLNIVDTEADAVMVDGKKVKAKKEVTCKNCKGTGGPAAWGASDEHRHAAAKRYMVKMFLQKLYNVWRPLEGLPVREPYAVEYLNRIHHEGPVVAPEYPSGGKPEVDSEQLEHEAAVAAELDAELKAG